MALTPAAIASPRQLYQGQPGTTVNTLYTAPALSANVTATLAGTSASSGSNTGSATAYITEIDITNTGNSTATFSLYLVPSGGTAGVANALLYNSSIAANDFRPIGPMKIDMPPGSTLQAVQSNAGIYTLTINGAEVQ